MTMIAFDMNKVMADDLGFDYVYSGEGMRLNIGARKVQKIQAVGLDDEEPIAYVFHGHEDKPFKEAYIDQLMFAWELLNQIKLLHPERITPEIKEEWPIVEMLGLAVRSASIRKVFKSYFPSYFFIRDQVYSVEPKKEADSVVSIVNWEPYWVTSEWAWHVGALMNSGFIWRDIYQRISHTCPTVGPLAQVVDVSKVNTLERPDALMRFIKKHAKIVVDTDFVKRIFKG